MRSPGRQPHSLGPSRVAIDLCHQARRAIRRAIRRTSLVEASVAVIVPAVAYLDRKAVRAGIAIVTVACDSWLAVAIDVCGVGCAHCT
jgi:hypothetical protein